MLSRQLSTCGVSPKLNHANDLTSPINLPTKLTRVSTTILSTQNLADPKQSNTIARSFYSLRPGLVSSRQELCQRLAQTVPAAIHRGNFAISAD